MKLIELRLKDVRNGMQQLVVWAGGCLHLADYEDGKFIVGRSRGRGLALNGVTKVWQLIEEVP